MAIRAKKHLYRPGDETNEEHDPPRSNQPNGQRPAQSVLFIQPADSRHCLDSAIQEQFISKDNTHWRTTTRRAPRCPLQDSSTTPVAGIRRGNHRPSTEAASTPSVAHQRVGAFPRRRRTSAPWRTTSARRPSSRCETSSAAPSAPLTDARSHPGNPRECSSRWCTAHSIYLSAAVLDQQRALHGPVHHQKLRTMSAICGQCIASTNGRSSCHSNQRSACLYPHWSRLLWTIPLSLLKGKRNQDHQGLHHCLRVLRNKGNSSGVGQ